MKRSRRRSLLLRGPHPDTFALTIAFPLFLIIVSLTLGLGIYYGILINTQPKTAKVEQQIIQPHNPPPCPPKFEPDFNGYMLQRAGNSNARLYIPNESHFLDQVGKGPGFTIAYWFQLPNFFFNSKRLLDTFCRMDNGRFFYQVEISAKPALVGDTNKAFLTFRLTYLESGTSFIAFNPEVSVNLAAWNQFTYAINFHPDPIDTSGFILDGFIVWINGIQYKTETNYRTSNHSNPTILQSSFAGVSLSFGALANLQPTTNLRNLAYFLSILTPDQVKGLVQNFDDLSYALTIKSCVGAWLLGYGDTSYKAFYSQKPKNCITGLITGDVQVMPKPST